MKILLPDSLPLHPVLPAGVVPVVYDVRTEIPEEHLDADAIVLWGNRLSRLRASAPRLGSVRWVQALSAGTDYLVGLFGPDVVITSGVGLHDRTVSEHTVALTLSHVQRATVRGFTVDGPPFWCNAVADSKDVVYDGMTCVASNADERWFGQK